MVQLRFLDQQRCRVCRRVQLVCLVDLDGSAGPVPGRCRAGHAHRHACDLYVGAFGYSDVFWTTHHLGWHCAQQNVWVNVAVKTGCSDNNKIYTPCIYFKQTHKWCHIAGLPKTHKSLHAHKLTNNHACTRTVSHKWLV